MGHGGIRKFGGYRRSRWASRGPRFGRRNYYYGTNRYWAYPTTYAVSYYSDHHPEYMTKLLWDRDLYTTNLTNYSPQTMTYSPNTDKMSFGSPNNTPSSSPSSGNSANNNNNMFSGQNMWIIIIIIIVVIALIMMSQKQK